jgi:hypothetical protein
VYLGQFGQPSQLVYAESPRCNDGRKWLHIIVIGLATPT